MTTQTTQLQALWWDWLSTSERLLRSLYEQMTALTLRDVAHIERIQPDIDMLTERLKQIDEQAVAAARGLAEELGAEPSLRGLVAVLEKAEGQQLQALANRVKIVARNIDDLMEKNHKLIDNELTYVNGTLALIAKAAAPKQSRFNAVGKATVLMDQVA